MLDPNTYEQIITLLPWLREATPAALQEFKAHAFLAEIPAGRDVFLLGDQVNAIALLTSGTVRVYKIGDTGREITLYRFSTGQSCILTANAILSQETFAAIATVEENARAVMIPSDVFRQWVDHYSVWRSFLFNLLSQRLSSMLEIVDEVTFGRMDSRVVGFLLDSGKETLSITHQEIADELGTSREVVSRILGTFAGDGLVKLGRGTITLLNREKLIAYVT